MSLRQVPPCVVSISLASVAARWQVKRCLPKVSVDSKGGITLERFTSRADELGLVAQIEGRSASEWTNRSVTKHECRLG